MQSEVGLFGRKQPKNSSIWHSEQQSMELNIIRMQNYWEIEP